MALRLHTRQVSQGKGEEKMEPVEIQTMDPMYTCCLFLLFWFVQSTRIDFVPYVRKIPLKYMCPRFHAVMAEWLRRWT